MTLAFVEAHEDEEPVEENATMPSFPGPGPGLALPREFGNYVLLEKIAEDGMAVVYKARQKSPDRLVAFKMIRSGELANAEDVRRFRQEADQAASLDHPHIVSIHDFGEIQAPLQHETHRGRCAQQAPASLQGRPGFRMVAFRKNRRKPRKM